MAAIGAYSLWAAMPLFWRLLEGVPAYVILTNRCLWSFPFLACVTLLIRNYRTALISVEIKSIPWIVLSSLLIAANWWIYIIGVHQHLVLEVSLGYFFSPLLTASLGVVVLGERLRAKQWMGVSLVVVGVAIYSLMLGHLPIIAIGLAVTFSFYSLVRKVSKAPAMAAITIEALVVFVLALIYLFFSKTDANFLQAWENHSTLLVLGGTLTAVPLLWFSVAMRGLTLTTMGLLNYISPSGKFLIAVFLFDETVSAMVLCSFVLIWVGISVYLADTLRNRSRAKN